MKKQFRTAMLSTACMLIVAVMSLTGVTYAWFTGGTTAKVQNINVAVVETTGGVQISKDGATWATALDYSASNYGKFAPVSTAGELNADNTMKFFNAVIDQADTAKITTTAASGNYVQEVFYIKNDTGADLTITMEGTNISENTTGQAHYASRIGFVIVGSTTRTADEDGTLPAEADVIASITPGVAQKWIYEPNALTHTVRAGTLYGTPATTESPLAYHGIKAASSTPFAWQGEGENKALVEPVYAPEDIEFDIANGEYMKVIFYVWVEGQDVDCENSVAASDFTVNLQFESHSKSN